MEALYLLRMSGEYIAAQRRALAGARSTDYHGHTDKLNSLAWSRDGRKIATGSVDKTGRVWSVERSVSVCVCVCVRSVCTQYCT